MPSNGTNRLMSDEAQISISALNQRVVNLDSNQRSLAESISSLAAKVEALFTSLNTKIEERARPQYNLLISAGVFGLGVIIAVGSQALSPIRENQTDLKAAVVEMAKSIAATTERANERFATIGDRFVSIRELDNRAARTTSEMARINLDLNALQSVIVPRVEQAERTRSVDAQFVNQQRQIDDVKKQFGDTFSLRDALLQMQRRIDALESAKRN